MNKPSKPFPEFPLYAHAVGQWAKTINRRTHYFGPWHDWRAALERYKERSPYLKAGTTPPVDATGANLETLVEMFLEAKDDLVKSGELRPSTYSNYASTAGIILNAFGKSRAIDSLGPTDFQELRRVLASRYKSLDRLSREITQVRMLFKFAYESQLINKPVRFGPNFQQPKARDKRLARTQTGPKLFEPHELHALIANSKQPMEAMIWLGINCGFGNHDCGLLEFTDLELDAGWHNLIRNKTAVPRRCKLWPETVASILDAIEKRPNSKLPYVFVTKYRRSFYKESHDNPISNAFRKLLDKTGLYRQGRTFYALRHTFETIAGESRDQVAVDYIMGHAPDSRDMSAVYRHKISDERLEDVSEHVRQWLGKTPRTVVATVG